MLVAYRLGTNLKNLCVNVCTYTPPSPPLGLHTLAFRWNSVPSKNERNNWILHTPFKKLNNMFGVLENDADRNIMLVLPMGLSFYVCISK